MLKHILSVFVFSIGLCAFCADAENLARNPQFLELKNKNAEVPEGKLPEPWYVHGGYKALPEGCGVSTTEKPEGYEGNSYAVSGNILITQSSKAVVPGKTYRASCMVKTKDTAPGAQIRLQVIWLDKTWRELTREENGKKEWIHKWTWVRSSPEWKELVITDLTAPEGAKYAKIRFGNGYSETGTAWFADFKFAEVTEEKAE